MLRSTTWQRTKTTLALIPFLAGSLWCVLCGIGLYVVADDAELCVKQVSAWNRVPARIIEATIETTSSNWGKNPTPVADLTSVKYRYTYNGKDYTSTDKGVYNEKDVKSVDLRSAFSYKLRDRREYNQTDYANSNFYCFVNPSNPDEAKLFCNQGEADKSIAYMMLFMGIVGSGTIGWIMYRNLVESQTCTT